jgi:hypothetical protein
MTKFKSIRGCAAFLLAALAPSLACANTGIFEGSGHTIKLIQSEDIHLRSEKVTISPGRGPSLFNGSAMDRVEYRCKFVLHNRSKKPVAIQVGFPLTSQFMGPPSHPEKYDATDVVLRYKFIVRDSEKTYHVRFSPHDQKLQFGAIFLWDMSFQSDEVRELSVAYEIPMAMGLGDTKRDWSAPDAKEWHSKLNGAIIESLDYVTVTGQSWAGPIDHATFEVNVGEFEQYLAERWIIEGLDWRSQPSDPEVMNWHIKDRLIHRQIGPDGWKEKDGVISWEFKNYRPKDGIGVIYRLTIFPKTPNEVPSFVKFVLGDKPSKENLSDLREIYLAWWGIAPKSKSVRQFVSNQRWYAPKDGMTADKLTAEQKAVVSAIERVASPAKEK